jgi:membrane associated rhomboid family serine protease
MTYSNVTLKLVILNFIVYALIRLIWPSGFYYLSMIPSMVLQGAWWQFLTYMFVHANFSHIFFNMFALYIFGTAIESRIGSREFLCFYLVVGILSGIFSFFCYYLTGNNVVLMGASGAIYGVMLLFAVFFPFSTIYIFALIPVRAPYLIIAYFAIELFSQVFAVAGGVAHLTHLGGLLFGFLYCLIRMKINPIDVWKRTR